MPNCSGSLTSFENSLFSKQSLLSNLEQGVGGNVLDFGAGEGVLRQGVEDLGYSYFACEIDERKRVLLEEQGVVCPSSISYFADRGISFKAIVVSSVFVEVMNQVFYNESVVTDRERSVVAIKTFSELLTDLSKLLEEDGLIIIRDVYFGSKSKKVLAGVGYFSQETVAQANSALFTETWGISQPYYGLECFPFLFTSLNNGFYIIKSEPYFQQDYEKFYQRSQRYDLLKKAGDLSTHVNLVLQKGGKLNG